MCCHLKIRRETGVTIDHPHGQIYALAHIPVRMERQAEAFRVGNPLMDAIAAAEERRSLVTTMRFVPEWAKYPFEIWLCLSGALPAQQR